MTAPTPAETVGRSVASTLDFAYRQMVTAQSWTFGDNRDVILVMAEVVSRLTGLQTSEVERIGRLCVDGGNVSLERLQAHIDGTLLPLVVEQRQREIAHAERIAAHEARQAEESQYSDYPRTRRSPYDAVVQEAQQNP